VLLIGKDASSGFVSRRIDEAWRMLVQGEGIMMFDDGMQLSGESQESQFEIQAEVAGLASRAHGGLASPPAQASSHRCSPALPQSTQRPEKYRPSSADKRHQSFDLTQLYLKEIGFSPLLSAEEEVYYARRALQGDETSKRRMIESNLRLVVKISRRYINRGMALLDMIEEGNLGLIHAVEKFDPERGFRFSTYATWWIRQSIERGLMNQARTIRLPVHVAKELNSMLRKAQQLGNRKSRDPTVEEIAEEADKTVAEIQRLYHLGEKVASADAPVLGNTGICLQDTFVAEKGQGPATLFQSSELRSRLSSWLNKLPEKHREVLLRRFELNGYDSDTLENVGNAIGLTRERVRQIQIEALKKLKAIVGRDGIARDIFAEFS
jgi:RNA polymerase nonessential primary-like sigma factor